MKISDAEINAANYQLTRYEEGRGNIQAVKEALEAAYTVRKQRKAAKRKRQRKEKDEKKQYVIQTWAGRLIPDLSLEELEKAREYLSTQTLASVNDVATYRQILCEIIERKEKGTNVSECVKGAVAFAEKLGKEKDKQVVESVKPTGLFTSLIGEGNWTADKAAAWGNLEALAGIASAVGQYGKVEPTPSKAPEWDGNASAFDAAMKPKA